MLLPASNLLGTKSSASILPEISEAIIISIPSVVEFCQLNEVCGRANEITNKQIAKHLRAINKCLKFVMLFFLFNKKPLLDETAKLPCNNFSRQRYQTIIKGIINRSQKKPGCANSKPLNIFIFSFRWLRCFDPLGI